MRVYNRRRFGLKPPEVWPLISIDVPVFSHRAWLRSGSTDLSMLRQIVLDREYAPLEHLELKTIIDCGAYAGYSSSFFLSRFPGARIVAVEPDPDNIEMCRRNVDQYGERIRVIRGAVWSHNAMVELQRGDSGEWSTSVRPAEAPGSEPIQAIDVPTVIEAIGGVSVDLLKIDIEGAEVEVFGASDTRWINSVRNIAIELHGPQCREAFLAAMQPYDYELLESGELTICRNIRTQRAA
jgi:FkbM family methyltransferase